jgi:hypothetical protein
MDRAQLEQLALEKISKTQAVPSSSMDRAQLEQMALDKMSGAGMTEIDPETEAILGFVNRAKYSIEPIQSNRKALLEQEYGKDNVLDQKGELYLKDDGKFRPVNKEGFSAADVADFAGATPEILGGIAGTGVGALAGLPTGGTASLPLAMGIGAAGAGAGSAIRQGLSAIIGNPQVATAGERALETGLSAGLGGLASGAGQIAKPYLQKAKTGISQFFKGAGKEVADTTGETLSKTTADTVFDLNGELKPIASTADDIMGNVADGSGRDVVKNEQKKLAQIALDENIPHGPTYAQSAQGKSLIAEAQVMDTPLIGGKVRKIVDDQHKQIEKNLDSITGKFIDVDTDAFEVGQASREWAETSVAATKKIASELYKAVEDEGANAMIGKRAFLNKFANKAGELGLINPDMTRSQWAADSGLTEDTFKKLQNTIFSGIDALKKNPSPKVRFEAANAITKTLKGTAEELASTNPNGHRILSGFVKELNTTMEDILNKEVPELGEKWTSANKTWAKYKNNEEMMKRIIRDGVGDEKIVKSVMSDTSKIKDLQEVIGKDNVRAIAKTHVREILGGLGKSGIGRASTALDAIRKTAPQLKLALGEADYKKLVNNLYFLNRTGQPLNVSRASLYNIWGNNGPGLKGFSMKVLGGAKTYAESKGTTITKAAKDKAIETTSKTINSATSQKNLSNTANLLSDNSQRRWASSPSPKGGYFAENEERRERSTAGNKDTKFRRKGK